MPDCIFCKIVEGSIPSAKVFESESVLAFLDISPASKGHTLVVPKKHYENFSAVPEKELKELMGAVQKISKAVVSATGKESFNIHVSNGRPAGQVIFHLHIHIIPRSENDSVGLVWSHTEYGENEAGELARKIGQKMGQG